MSVSLQVVYPITDETNFDYDYYLGTHMPMVDEYFGTHLERTLVTKGVAGGPDTPPDIYAIATLVFADMDAMNAALAKADPVMADIKNFTNTAPQMLVGEVVLSTD